jgi:hypothetical protein
MHMNDEGSNEVPTPIGSVTVTGSQGQGRYPMDPINIRVFHDIDVDCESVSGRKHTPAVA